MAALLALAAVIWLRPTLARADDVPDAEDLARLHQHLSGLRAALAGVDTPLRRGDRGEAVRLVQEALRVGTGQPTRVDGVFGPATEAAVRAFQIASGLAGDGVVGSRTLAALADALERRTPRRHIVQPGETLSAVARRYGVPVLGLAAVNGLRDPDRLISGAVLWVPDAETARAAEAAARRAAPGTSGQSGTEATSPAAPGTGGEPGTGETPGTPAGAGEARGQDQTGGRDEVGRNPGGVEARAYTPGTGAPAGMDGGAAWAGPVALTFNDGPDPEVTPALLDLLAEHGVRATFFFTGDAARRHPDMVRRAAAEGHEIANHGWDESLLTGLDALEVRRRLERAQQALREQSGREPRLFRPAGARLDGATVAAARALGLTVVLWTNIGAEDAPGVTADVLAERLRRATYPGAIIMLHADRRVGLEALRQVLPAWKAAGVQLLPLSELLRQGAELQTGDSRDSSAPVVEPD